MKHITHTFQMPLSKRQSKHSVYYYVWPGIRDKQTKQKIMITTISTTRFDLSLVGVYHDSRYLLLRA